MRSKIFLILSILTTLTVLGITAAYAAPAVQISTNQGEDSLCMNRDGGGVSDGTYVIGYNCGNANNAFEFAQLSNVCNGGVVTSTCPFTDIHLDANLIGQPIVKIEAYTLPSSCVGTNGETTIDNRLEACPDSYGDNGGWHTEWVAPGFDNNNPDCVISVGYTNYENDSTLYTDRETGYTNAFAIMGIGVPSSECPASAQLYEDYS